MKAEDEVRAKPGHLSLDIAIVGGGIAGLAAAVALRRVGHKVIVCMHMSRLTAIPVCIVLNC